VKPVDQRYFAGPTVPLGDCFRACVASIFELELDEVPHFMDLDYRIWHVDRSKSNWWSMVNAWAWDFGVGFNRLSYPARRRPKNWHPGWWIASVRSRCQDGATHAIVMHGNEVKHDPSPLSRALEERYWFLGEGWFELAHPAFWMEKIDWRELFAMRLTEGAV
jgi:hypothetical protein